MTGNMICDITLCGERLIPDTLGGLFWPAQEMLIVSDLHFEKGSSYAARGVMLPPYDTRTTLMRLTALYRKYKPKRVISLGDAFHDADAEARMAEVDAQVLEGLMSEARWLWILGNHDPAPPARFQSACETSVNTGALIFRHEPQDSCAEGEIAGHLHPCARVVGEGRTLRRRCFASGGGRLIMPALGAYTGGLNVLDPAFAAILPRPTAFVMGRDGVYPIGRERLTEAKAAPQHRRAG